jgi:hypothetical protein
MSESYWLEVNVTTDGEAAEAVAELLRPFAYADGVVLEQLGDQTDLSPDVTVKIYITLKIWTISILKPTALPCTWCRPAR